MFNCFIIAQSKNSRFLWSSFITAKHFFSFAESSTPTIFKKVSLSILGTLKTKKFNREFNLMRYENKAEKS